MKPKNPVYLFVLPWRIEAVGGVNEVVKNLYVSLLSSSQFTPAILVSTWDGVEGQDPWTISTGLLSPVDGPWKARLAFWIFLPKRLLQLRRLISRFDVRIINPHFPGLYCLHFVLLRWCGLFQGKFILSFHGSEVRRAVRTIGVERGFWQILIRNADAVVCCSRELAQVVADFVPSVRERISVVHNGIDAEHFMSESNQRTVGLKLPAEPFVLAIGTLEWQKGHDVLIEAFDQVREQHPGLRLLIVGRDGGMAERLQREIVMKNLGERIVLVKGVPHPAIPELLGRAKVVVQPSRAEGLPLVLLEAGVLAKPVIATRVGGIPELVEDGVNGILVPADDAHGLASAISGILKDPEKSGLLGERLRTNVLHNFSWRNACAEYSRIATN